MPSFRSLTDAPKRRLALFMTLAILGLTAIVAIGVQPGNARAWKLTGSRPSDPTTQLYFTDYGLVPPHLAEGESHEVHYRIDNHENRAATYTYRVTLTQGATTRVVESGQFLILDGQSVTRPATITATKAGQSLTLAVELLEVKQTISVRTES